MNVPAHAFAALLGGALLAPRAAAAPPSQPPTPSFEARVDCERRVQQVYWDHTLWPESNPAPKPRLDAVLPRASLERRVEDALLAERVAERFGLALTAERLQRELDRIARDTRRPQMLRDIVGALGGDARLVAACVARPLLAQRLLQEAYRREVAAGEAGEAPDFAAWWGAERAGAGLDAGGDALAAARATLLPAQDDAVAPTFGPIADAACGAEPWTPTRTELPDRRSFHTAVWTGSEMIVWGGVTDASNFQHGDGGRYDPATDTWTPIPADAASPVGRSSHTAVWTGTEMIVWGGAAGYWALGTGGRYNPATRTWAPVTATGAPSARTRHTAVWTGSQMIVFGGDWAGTGGRYDPLADTWTPTSTGAGAPVRPDGHTAVWTGSRMIVWGGRDGSGSYTSGGALYDPAGDSWSATSTGANVPSARADHVAVWSGTEMIVWGGKGATGRVNTGGRYDPASNSWRTTSTGAGVPSKRSAPTAVFTGSEMIVWGGREGDYIPTGTGGRYDPAANVWRPVTGASAPEARYAHTAVWSGTEMIVWGGAGASGDMLSSGARYTPGAASWVPTSTGSAPRQRMLASGTWTGAVLVVWGGTDNFFAKSYLLSGSRYDPALDAWTPMSTAGAPAGRKEHTAVWTGTEVVVWGGTTASASLNTGGRYRPLADTWAPTSTTAGVPSPRRSHTAVWSGTSMIVWGGVGSSAPLGDGARYDPATNAWSPVSATNAPSARERHAAVWTGTRMVVWGGAAAAGATDTGSRYDPQGDSWLGRRRAARATPRSGPAPR